MTRFRLVPSISILNPGIRIFSGNQKPRILRGAKRRPLEGCKKKTKVGPLSRVQNPNVFGLKAHTLNAKHLTSPLVPHHSRGTFQPFFPGIRIFSGNQKHEKPAFEKNKLPFGRGSKKVTTRPQVLVHVSIFQGKPFWGYPIFDPQPFGWFRPLGGTLVNRLPS